MSDATAAQAFSAPNAKRFPQDFAGSLVAEPSTVGSPGAFSKNGQISQRIPTFHEFQSVGHILAFHSKPDTLLKELNKLKEMEVDGLDMQADKLLEDLIAQVKERL